MLNEEQRDTLEHPELLELLENEDLVEWQVSLVKQEIRDQLDK
jgi:hypothetical protein